MKKNYADMDPLEEIRAIREEISGEFKSLRELGAYLREHCPDNCRQSTRSNAPKAEKKPVGRQKAAKQAVC